MTAIFFALSFLSGFFETGPLMMSLSQGTASGSSAVVRALACVLCYQIGNLAPRPLALSKPLVTLSGLLGALCFAIAATSPLLLLPAAIVPAASLAGTALVSACIQSVRALMKGSVPKMAKRGARVAGFAVGFFCTPLTAPGAAALAAVLALIALRRAPAISPRLILPRLRGLNLVMIFHQMHYFVYCYAAFIIAFTLGGRPAAVAAFLASWIVYVVSPLLYRKAGNFLRVFFAGHSLLLVLLALIYAVPSLPAKIVLYLLTGIGGTTEFCIGRLSKKWGCYDEDAQTFSENAGHVLGVICCLLLFLIGENLIITPLFAAICALAAIVCMAKTAAARAPTRRVS